MKEQRPQVHTDERNLGLRWQRHQLNRYLTRAVYGRLYRDSNRDIGKTIMVAGTARSGTTWLASMIASQLRCRIMFEPFHAEKVAQFRDFYYFQYMRPDEVHDALRTFCMDVFTGNIRHRWIDREVNCLSPRYRLVKEIRANLFLGWIHAHFPSIPLIFIVRHPCAVVSSRMHLRWATDADIAPMLAQPKLVNDFLADKLDVIRAARTDEEKHAVIWCINHLVPLQQLGSGKVTTVFYERLCLHPDSEIPRLFHAIGHPYTETVFDSAHRPSNTSRKTSAIGIAQDRVTRWRKELSSQQIERILKVVRSFELDHLYGDSCVPAGSA